jgi:hypothetical protein
MTPKENAEELVDKFLKSLYDDGSLSFKKILYKYAKKCAIVAVDEIINANPHSNPLNTNAYSTMNYWQEVKHEIEKL